MNRSTTNLGSHWGEGGSQQVFNTPKMAETCILATEGLFPTKSTANVVELVSILTWVDLNGSQDMFSDTKVTTSRATSQIMLDLKSCLLGQTQNGQTQIVNWWFQVFSSVVSDIPSLVEKSVKGNPSSQAALIWAPKLAPLAPTAASLGDFVFDLAAQAAKETLTKHC
jgi:hypothetical protein